MTEIQREENKTVVVTIRLPSNLLAKVDDCFRKRFPRCSRNSWILEAVVEKLEREGQSKLFEV